MGRLVMVLAIGCTGDELPRLDTIEPAAGPHGQRVRLTGRHLCGDIEGGCEGEVSSIELGTDPPVSALVAISTSDIYHFIVPDAAPIGATPVVLVTVFGLRSNALPFEVLP